MNKDLEIIKHFVGGNENNKRTVIKAAEQMANRIEYLEKQLAKSPAEREKDDLEKRLAGR